MKTKLRVEILLLGEKPSRGCKPFGVPAPHFLLHKSYLLAHCLLEENTIIEVSHVSCFCSQSVSMR
jgi:hypothetical protein